jgi:hypothetical protein
MNPAPLPNVTYTCGTNSDGVNYLNFVENNGVSWLWTTTTGGRFYTSSALSVNSDSSISHLQAPFVTYYGLYKVKITDANGCIGSGTYNITPASCSVILAVTNLSFTAQKQGGKSLLAWSTEAETNNSHFDVERSGDGLTWQRIGVVNSHGNSASVSNYRFIDGLPQNGINYYRLKEVDVNGLFAYSPVRTVQFEGEWPVKLYPNPAQSFLVLEFNNEKDEKGLIVIHNTLGKTVLTMEQQLVRGLNRVTINQLQPLAQGTYVVTVSTGDHVFRSKFIKGGNQ